MNINKCFRPRDVAKEITEEDLALLCDLFYLPFEHGAQGISVLQEFNWLKSNAHLITLQNQKTTEKTPEVRLGDLVISFQFHGLIWKDLIFFL